jgi:hypothetical protein
MLKFYEYLVNKLRFKRFAMSSNIRLLNFGAIYQGSYSNWKHDPQPQVFCMYSDPKYTHGLNLHYFTRSDKAWFGRTIYILKRAGQQFDGRFFYKYLKSQKPNIIKVAYRMYHTNLLNAKMVSGGLTPLDDLSYKSSDPFITQLNETLKSSSMKSTSAPKIAFSPTELQNRISQAINAIDIRKQRAQNTGAFGVSPFVRK